MGCRTDEWYRQRAKELHHREGELEIDDETPEQCKVSNGCDNGAYVQAWVWVPDDVEEDDAMFHCDKCGDLGYALMEGSVVGDRVLEGVQFEIRRADDGTYVATTPVEAEEYMKTLNEHHWCTEVGKAAAQADTLTCPTCKDDIDGPAAEA